MTLLKSVEQDLDALANPAKARVLAGFFKTGPGEYGEGDVFLGITVPAQRSVARRYAALDLDEIAALLASGIHERRLTALLILVSRHRKADVAERRRLLDFYLAHVAGVNNWDLVDLSAPPLVGETLLGGRPRDVPRLLTRLARSTNLWERRIAIVATYAFIRERRFEPTLTLAALLLTDGHDLIHKAVGWMLREVGKREKSALTLFLDHHATTMPRTMLRYAIERLSDTQRRRYLTRRSRETAAMH